jgi:hypothetical protein
MSSQIGKKVGPTSFFYRRVTHLYEKLEAFNVDAASMILIELIGYVNQNKAEISGDSRGLLSLMNLDIAKTDKIINMQWRELVR